MIRDWVALAERAVKALERIATAAEVRNAILADPELAQDASRADRQAKREYVEASRNGR